MPASDDEFSIISDEDELSDSSTGVCTICHGRSDPQLLLTCCRCHGSTHGACASMSSKLVRKARTYQWECMTCKTCAVCQNQGDDESMLFCDRCDRGVHMYCNTPKLKSVPSGDFFCQLCREGRFDGQTTPHSGRKAGEFAKRTTKASGAVRRRASSRESSDDDGDDSSSCEFPAPKRRVGRKQAYRTLHEDVVELDDASDDSIEHDLAPKKSTKRTSAVTPSPKSKTPQKHTAGSSRSASKSKPRPTPPETPESQTTVTATVAALASAESTIATADSKPANPPPPKIEVSAQDKKWFQQAHAVNSIKPSAKHIVSNTTAKKKIQIGKFELETWYLAPYPEEYSNLTTLYMCEFCLSYMKSAQTLKRHAGKCIAKGRPPGNEIYRSGTLQVWEVDGNISTQYCQNMCLLAKLFLDHKTLYYDVESFLFYVLTVQQPDMPTPCSVEFDEFGSHFIGYFSKEKSSLMSYNVSCILTLPCIQRKGYGRLLIDFSYLLSRREGRLGTPERPLSYLGKLTYERYWKDAVYTYLHKHSDAKDLSIQGTGMTATDVTSTLIRCGILVRVGANQCELAVDYDHIAKHCAKLEHSSNCKLDPDMLRWIPFIPLPSASEGTLIAIVYLGVATVKSWFRWDQLHPRNLTDGSCVSPVVLMVLRIIFALYFLCVWLASVIPDPTGFQYYTVWNYTIQVVYFLLAAGHSIAAWRSRGAYEAVLETNAIPFVSGLTRFTWVLFEVCASVSILVMLVFWIVLHPANTAEQQKGDFEFFGVSQHMLNAFQMVIELMLSQHVYQPSHAIFVMIWPLVYVFFQWVHQAAGGSYAYFFIDPSISIDGAWYIGLMILHILLFFACLGLVKLRERIWPPAGSMIA